MRVASWFAEWLKASDLKVLGNKKKISNLSEDKGYYPDYPPKINFQR